MTDKETVYVIVPDNTYSVVYPLILSVPIDIREYKPQTKINYFTLRVNYNLEFRKFFPFENDGKIIQIIWESDYKRLKK